jgi:hypothetical protein
VVTDFTTDTDNDESTHNDLDDEDNEDGEDLEAPLPDEDDEELSPDDIGKDGAESDEDLNAPEETPMSTQPPTESSAPNPIKSDYKPSIVSQMAKRALARN